MQQLRAPQRPGFAGKLFNIGAQVVNINVVERGVPAFTRDITTGGNQYTEEIQKALSVSFDEAERLTIGRLALLAGDQRIAELEEQKDRCADQ